jgi:hypothetical protein
MPTTGAATTFGSGLNPTAFQNIGHRPSADAVTRIGPKWDRHHSTVTSTSCAEVVVEAPAVTLSTKVMLFKAIGVTPDFSA